MSKTASAHVVSRRSVLRAAAWTLPAVAVAVATPALAASGEVALPFPPADNSGPRPAPPRQEPSVLGYTAKDNYSFSSSSGVITARTIMAVGGDVAPMHLPKGFTTLTYGLQVTNSKGEEVFYEEDVALIPEGHYGVMPEKERLIKGLSAGDYTVTWQIYGATDSTNRVLQPLSSTCRVKSEQVPVKTW